MERFLNTPDAVAAAVRDGRTAQGLAQAELARRAGVGRRFVVDLEAGHPRAELGKVLAVLSALGIHATALPAPRSRRRPCTMWTFKP
ncbi:helix-turn-helix transcriptional regulator [Tsukamurella sp. PLM1]|uniref:helix-turn-helix transcriptional regulator n=1 Tax=Tsukamurella sp. PLM1 TaxID=2929795 RepID=UPI0020BF36B3|nr:helix-turn-helix transcriptional regulator [Tsukamurella sp. PLM1]